ncbi:MAG: energy-coupling factor transporter ATPase [Lachnospiraceae bacterium]|nr:energy-coupling factor transporter ATPase [Lachnospiraceae bacterium]
MIIKLDHVNYIYNPDTVEKVIAVDDVNLEIGGNSLTAIIGSTGSGKSTLIQMLNGLLKPTSGTVSYDGEVIFTEGKETKEQKKKIRDLRCRVGLVFQYPEYQLFDETVLKDVCYGPKNQGFTQEEAEKKARKALEEVHMPEKSILKSPFDLSGGQKRRAAIAGVLAMEPEVLILDEPTAGLDPKGKTEVLDLLKRYQREKETTVILVSHSMEEVAQYADRVIAMHKSKVILDGPTHEVFSHREELEAIGLGVPEVQAFTESLGIKDAITVQEACDAILQRQKAE